MTKNTKQTIFVFAVVFGLLGLFIVNSFIYPFSPPRPIFSDVEKVFNRIQVPNDWVVVRESQNDGYASGRLCWIEEESTCFHKSATYKVPKGEKYKMEELINRNTGCSIVDKSVPYPENGIDSYGFTCILENNVEINTDFGGANNEVYIGVYGDPFAGR